jgi:hypothetical protein
MVATDEEMTASSEVGIRKDAKRFVKNHFEMVKALRRGQQHRRPLIVGISFRRGHVN